MHVFRTENIKSSQLEEPKESRLCINRKHSHQSNALENC